MKNRIPQAGWLVLSTIILINLISCGPAQPKASTEVPSPQLDSTQAVATSAAKKKADAVMEDIPYDADKGKKYRTKDHTSRFSPLLSSFWQATPADLRKYYPEPLDMIVTDEGTDASILNYYANEFKPKYRNYIWIKVRYKTQMREGHPVEVMTYEHQLILPGDGKH